MILRVKPEKKRVLFTKGINEMRLITFLGRVPKSEQSGYRKTTYEFSDGSKTEPVSFIGWPLIERLKPETIVILGTAGSMWDELLGSIKHEVDDDLQMELMSQVENKAVEQYLLDRLEPSFEVHHGINCELVIIPYGKDMDEQVEILDIISNYVPKHERVSLDVTHGFRHLPMLGLISAQYLQRIKKAEIKGIYYGMFDHDLRYGEVYDLQGMLQLNDWVFALSQFDKDGDYGVFSGPLSEDGFDPEGINSLEKAAYYERVFSVSKSRQQLSTFKKFLGAELPGAGKLFTQALLDRIEWSDSNNLNAHQRKLARFYLNNGDYVRATVFGKEAFISSLMKEDEKEYEYSDRKVAEDEFRGRVRGTASDQEPYWCLNELRNCLAHGTTPNENSSSGKATQSALENQDKLDAYIRRLFRELGIS